MYCTRADFAFAGRFNACFSEYNDIILVLFVRIVGLLKIIIFRSMSNFFISKQYAACIFLRYLQKDIFFGIVALCDGLLY